MSIVVCYACDRRRIIEKPEKKNYVCSICGAQKALIIRTGHLWASRTEKDGKNKTEAMRDTYAGLKKISEFKKYNDKWPLAKFKGIFGIWPPDEISEVPPSPASKALLVWIKRSNDAWKRAKRLEEKEKAPQIVLRLPEHEIEYMPSFMTAADWEVKL